MEEETAIGQDGTVLEEEEEEEEEEDEEEDEDDEDAEAEVEAPQEKEEEETEGSGSTKRKAVPFVPFRTWRRRCSSGTSTPRRLGTRGGQVNGEAVDRSMARQWTGSGQVNGKAVDRKWTGQWRGSGQAVNRSRKMQQWTGSEQVKERQRTGQGQGSGQSADSPRKCSGQAKDRQRYQHPSTRSTAPRSARTGGSRRRHRT